MSKRFYYDEFCEEIFDEEIQTYPSNQSICGILNKQAERIAELEEQIDYSFKINTWLIKKYGKEFWQDIGIDEDDDTITNLIKLDEVFDKIYEEMKKEMPKKWYEYGFGGKK